MQKLKVLSVKEPERDKWGRAKGLYRLMLSDGKSEFPSDMDENGYKRFLIEQRMLEKGIDANDIEELKSLSYNKGYNSGCDDICY